MPDPFTAARIALALALALIGCGMGILAGSLMQAHDATDAEISAEVEALFAPSETPATTGDHDAH